MRKLLKPSAGETDRSRAERRRVITRAGLLAAAAVVLLLGVTFADAAGDASRASNPLPNRHPIEQTGVDFVQLSPAEREAYAAGFILGAATVQALGKQAELGEVLDGLRAHRELIFSYGPNVYAATLREYYASTETVNERIAEAMVFANEHLKAGKGEL